MYRTEIIEYNLIPKGTQDNANIAACIMVKNEHLRLGVTLASLVGIVKGIIAFDTGSTDDTLEILHDFCHSHSINLYLKKGEFVDFSTSRNILLDFADTIPNIDFLLLLDCNDELVNGDALQEFCNSNINNDEYSAYHIKQQWKASIIIEYINIRLIKPKYGWKYSGVVHEYLHSGDLIAYDRVPDVILFQDRCLDDKKTSLRFEKDYELLLKESQDENACTPRTIYYLAQTCHCLKKLDEAVFFYKKRLDITDGFFEERYHAAYSIAQILLEQSNSFEIYSGYFLYAFSIMKRAEPLVRIAEHYIKCKAFSQAFLFLKAALDEPIPKCGLFCDIEMYNYYRYHLMGIVAYYVNETEIGKKACEIAISKRNNIIDRNNLEYYKDVSNLNEPCSDP